MGDRFQDPYREYPLRFIGYVNAIVRPWKEVIPKSAYQLSLGVMHTYILTNAYDYANRVDSSSWMSSFADCMTWHFAASWVAPALVVDNVVKLSRKYVPKGPLVPALVAYATLPLASVVIDRATNWYFYGFWSAGTKERPRLRL
jgi:hypothetical protein